MKIEKKIKKSLVSLLTVIPLTFSVVGCESIVNKIHKNLNYKKFVSKVTNLSLEEKYRKYSKFVDYNTSLNDFWAGTDHITKNVEYSINDKNLKEDNINFYDISSLDSEKILSIESQKLTSLKEKEIDYDPFIKEIMFNLNGKWVGLNNILFSSNFDLNIINLNDFNNIEKKNHYAIFKNITLFYKMKTIENKNDFSVKFTVWSDNNIQLWGKPNFDTKNIKMGSEKIWNPKAFNLGLDKETKGENIFWHMGNFSHKGYKLEKYESITKVTPKIINTLFTVSGDNVTIGNNKLIFECNNIFALFNLKSIWKKENSKDLKVLSAKFFGKFDKKNYILKKDSNFIAEFGEFSN
ncbi:hypothetical protein JTY60_01765 [symbiont of Argiope bruennichi]|uniref:hypothetical protein n=1 Tax=symbiont of Argiope bruennichi TaxID=2810479 RepID=UPI003DA694FA